MLTYLSSHRSACVCVVVLMCMARFGQAQEAIPVDDWTPDYVGAQYTSQYRYFRMENGVGCLFDGKPTLVLFTFCANKDWPLSPLPKTYSDGYAFRYPDLFVGDLIPYYGTFYVVEPFSTKQPANHMPVAKRMPKTKIPKGVSVSSDKYIFPIQDGKNALRWSGKLHNCFIYFSEIAPSKDDANVVTVKMGILLSTRRDAVMEEQGREKDIVWKWHRVGDAIDIGGVRHKLSAIVPPKEPKELGRDEGRMIGWIELDPEPLKDEPAGK